MASFRSQKKGWATPRLVSFGGFNSKFPKSMPAPFIWESPPPPGYEFLYFQCALPVVSNRLSGSGISLT